VKDIKLENFYEEHTWGANTIKKDRDMPNLKLNHILQALEKEKNVDLLEIGCGSGRILASIREHSKQLKLTGVDPSKAQITLAKKENQENKIDFFVGDGEHLQFPDNSFTHVIIMDVLEHVEKPSQLLQETWRVLKKNGTLIAFIPAENEGVYWLSKKIFGQHFKEKSGGHIQQFTFKELDTLLEINRFSIEKKNYSYHLFGSIMDYALYTLLLYKPFAKLFWSKNKYYQQDNANEKPTLLSRVLNGILSWGNMFAFYESKLLFNTPIMAIGLHVIAIKK